MANQGNLSLENGQWALNLFTITLKDLIAQVVYSKDGLRWIGLCFEEAYKGQLLFRPQGFRIIRVSPDPLYEKPIVNSFWGKDSNLPPLDIPFLTPFRKKVMEALRAIPFGSVITYGELARSVGNPDGARAVGSVLAWNPLPILFPCHRVVARDGLGGFAWGLLVKRYLLNWESSLAPHT